MESISFKETPRSNQIITVEGLQISVGVDYNQTSDSWGLTIENTDTGEGAEGVVILPYRPLLYQRRERIGLTGDFFAIPESQEAHERVIADGIKYDDLINGDVALYFILPEEIESI